MKNKHLQSYSDDNAFTLQIERGDEYIGGLHFAKRELIRHLPPHAPTLHFSHDGAELDSVRQFIALRYHRAFDACINVTFPELVWIRNRRGQVLAAVGIRSACVESLFLEQYTDAPIETLLASARDRIVEIGNLVSVNRSATIALFCCVALILERRGISFATATGTHFLEHQLTAMGMAVTRLCAACDRRLTTHDDQWGQYYQTDPHVLAGNVSACAKHLRQSLHVSLNQPLAHALHTSFKQQAIL